MRIRFLHGLLIATGFALIIMLVTALQVSVVAADHDGTPHLPNDYRFWYHVGSKSITADAATAIGLPAEVFGNTFDSVFANVVALNDMRNKAKTFRDGAEFVAAFFKLSNPVAGLDQPGELAFVAVMEKDSEEYASTGGWGFSVFGPDKTELTDLESTCFACHQSKADSDFVFSTLNDRAIKAVPASDNGVFLPPDYQNKLYWRSASVIRPEAATAIGLPAEIFGNTTDSIYMNNDALNALGSETRPFPVGSLFVADFHKAAFPVEGLGAEGDLAFTAVMLKGDPGTGDDASTGDWRFEAFGPDGKPLTQLRGACISCHATKASNDYVFSGS
jgi:hypothetical protein